MASAVSSELATGKQSSEDLPVEDASLPLLQSEQFARVEEICSRPAEERSDDDIDCILYFVQQVPFLKQLSADEQRRLCRVVNWEQFFFKQFVFHRGSCGEKFYIIMSGSVSVQVPDRTTPCPRGVHGGACGCPGRPLTTVAFLEPGQGFGELALQSDEPRSSTIQAVDDDTQMLTCTKADFLSIAGHVHREFLDKRVRFLRKCPGVEEALQAGRISSEDITAMANCLSEKSFSCNDMVIFQGKRSEEVLFVLHGQLALVRMLDVSRCGEADKSRSAASRRAPRCASSIASATSEGRRPSRAGSTSSTAMAQPPVLEVGHLRVTEFFGHQFAADEAYPVSLLADPWADVLVVDKHSLMRKVPNRLHSIFLRQTPAPLSSDSELLRMQRTCDRWSSYRGCLREDAERGLLQPAGFASAPRSVTASLDVEANREVLSLGATPPMERSWRRVSEVPELEIGKQADSSFRRRRNVLRTDPGVHKALARIGHASMLNSRSNSSDVDDRTLEQFWSRVNADVVPDLDDEEQFCESLEKLEPGQVLPDHFKPALARMSDFPSEESVPRPAAEASQVPRANSQETRHSGRLPSRTLGFARRILSDGMNPLSPGSGRHAPTTPGSGRHASYHSVQTPTWTPTRRSSSRRVGAGAAAAGALVLSAR